MTPEKRGRKDGMKTDSASRYGVPGEGAPAPAEVSASFMHRVRIRFLGMRGLFEIYAVDGEVIRGEPGLGADIDFTNWGEHYHFPFIPLHEIWLDVAAVTAAPEDADVFVDAATYEWRIMADGTPYEDVWQRVEDYETKERRKRAGIPLEGKTGSLETDPSQFYLGVLGTLSDGTIVELVHARDIQNTFDDDFTEGGNSEVYSFVPKGYEWIGDDIFPQERAFIVVHETDEVYWMRRGLGYDAAHKKASELEWYCRHHVEQLPAILELLGFRVELPQPGLVENSMDGIGRLDAWIQNMKRRRDADAQMQHMFRLMLKQRRLAIGKGNRVKTRGLRPGAWIYPHAVERAYADRIARWLYPLRHQVIAYLRQHGEALLRADAAVEFPSDPTIFSPGPDRLSHEPQLPQHPVSISMVPVPVRVPAGGARPDPAEPGAPDFPPHYPRWHTRTVAQFLEDIKRPYLQENFTFGSGVNPPTWKKSPWTPELSISTEQPTRTTPPQEEGVEHYDRVPGARITTFVKTTQGWVAQMWPEDVEKAPAEIKMGLGQTADAAMAASVKEWSKHTTRVLGLSFKNAAGDWWPDLRGRWASRNYDLVKNLARDYIGRINDHVERAVTNGWSYKDLTKDILGMGKGMTGARARLIARDQIGKLNGQLTQAQQTEVGIDVYEWDTAGDERVRGRPGGKYEDSPISHWAMQGMLCKWSDSSVYSDDGGHTWHARTPDMPDGTPGDDIQCRCTAIPSFGGILKAADDEIDGEPEPREEEEPAAAAAPGEVPTAPAAAAAYLSDVVGWKSLLVRFTKAAPELAKLGNTYANDFPLMKEQIAYVGEQNQIARKVGVRITGPMREHGYAWNAYLPGGRSAIGINFRKWGANSEKWEKPLLDNVITGFHPQGTGTFKSVIDHELGHAIDHTVNARLDREIMKLWSSLDAQEIEIGLSAYANTNMAEFIAEGWAEYRNNPNPRLISRKIGERLEALLKAKGEAK